MTKDLSTSVDPILPKQWKHWLLKAGFKTSAKINPVYYWKGFGRHWRINCYGELQASERYDDFDRWANSVFYTHRGNPKNLLEFLLIVTKMKERISRKERLIKYLSSKGTSRMITYLYRYTTTRKVICLVC